MRFVWTLVVPMLGWPAASAETLTHAQWGFRMNIPDAWRLTSRGGVSEPIVISMGGSDADEIRIFRAPAPTGLDSSNSEEIETAVRAILGELDRGLAGLHGIQSSFEPATRHQPAAVEMLAGVAFQEGFRHLQMRAILDDSHLFVLVAAIPTDRLESASDPILRAFDSFVLTERSSLSTDQIWLIVAGLVFCCGLAVAAKTTERPTKISGASASLGTGAILVFSFVMTGGEFAEQRARYVQSLDQAQRMEAENPGISRRDYDDRRLHRQYIDTIASLRSASFDRGILALALRADHPTTLSIWTYALLHGSWSHLLWNLVFIVLCGSAVEQTTGRRFFIATLVLGSLAAAAGHWWFHREPDVLIGASGAASALLGAALVLDFWRPLGPSIGFWRGRRRFALTVPLGLILTAWIVSQVLSAFDSEDSAALALHASGFTFGTVFALLARTRLGAMEVSGARRAWASAVGSSRALEPLAEEEDDEHGVQLQPADQHQQRE